MPLHEFGTPREKPKFFTERKKTQFLDLNSTATIRILSNAFLTIYTHFINKATVVCLEDDCPICMNNKSLIMQYPTSFRDDPKYSPRREVNIVNVLDKSPVRVCTNCGEEVRANSGAGTCPKCNTILTAVPVPSMKVKVLSRGSTLFDQLDAINNATMDEKGEPVGLPKFDLTLVVSGTGKSKVITPIPGQITDIATVNEEDLYDLDSVTIKLDAEEMLDLQRGVSLRDIFSARKATVVETKTADFLSPAVLDGIQDDVDALFKKA